MEILRKTRYVLNMFSTKMLFFFLFCGVITLSGCGQKDLGYFPDVMFDELVITFSPFSFENMPNLNQQTEIFLDFPESSFAGSGNLKSDKNTNGKNEKSDISLRVNWKGEDFLPDEEPKSFTTQLQTLFIDGQMYVLLNKLDLFLGNGNVEANFFNLMAKDALYKRINIGSGGETRVGMIETPRYDELFQWIKGSVSNEETDMNKIDNVKKILNLLSKLMQWDINVNSFELDEMVHNPVVIDGNKKSEMLTMMSSDKKVIWESITDNDSIDLNISLIDILDTELNNTNYPTLHLNLKREKANKYALIGDMRLLHDSPKQLPEWSFESKIILNKKNGLLNMDFDVMVNITSLLLAKGETLNISLKGEQELQKSEIGDGMIVQPTETLSL